MFRNFAGVMEHNVESIRNKIYEIRGQRVMLDRDLAELYGVTTGNLNKAVKRNIRRFPCDFMFQLTKEEWDSLRFQIGILDVGRGKYTKFLPHAFTEQRNTRDWSLSRFRMICESCADFKCF